MLILVSILFFLSMCLVAYLFMVIYKLKKMLYLEEDYGLKYKLKYEELLDKYINLGGK